MPTRNTPTQLQDSEGNSRTATHLSTHLSILVLGNKIGAIKSIDFDENREVKFYGEVGTDGMIDSAPTSPTTITGSCTRIRYDRQRIFEAFGRSFIHLHSQRIPFDIQVQDFFHDGDSNNTIITTLQNVWFKSQRFSYTSDDYIIAETATFQAERIFSVMNNKNVAQAVANGRTQPIILNAYEQEADRGAFTGALDAPGLLNAFLADPRN